jgi:hypothetical protein
MAASSTTILEATARLMSRECYNVPKSACILSNWEPVPVSLAGTFGETVAARIGDSRAAFHASSSYTPESPRTGTLWPARSSCGIYERIDAAPRWLLAPPHPRCCSHHPLANKRRRHWRRREGGKEAWRRAMDAAAACSHDASSAACLFVHTTPFCV